jgi:hypothetical protein
MPWPLIKVFLSNKAVSTRGALVLSAIITLKVVAGKAVLMEIV